MIAHATQKTVLSLFDYSGVWSQPYADAGYRVIRYDLQHGHDVRLIERDLSLFPVQGVLAAPPCTHFANSGARWWAEKGNAALIEGLATVDAVFRIVWAYQPTWWALENPSGRLSRFIGPAKYSFDPCDFGDPYTKRTHLWGHFAAPAKCPVEPVLGSKMHRLSGSDKNGRSITPAGFARAFFEANP